MRIKLFGRLLLCTVLLVATSECVRADKFFGVSASGDNGANVNVTGGNIIKLTDQLINQEKKFAPLAGSNYSGAISYGGVPNALKFTENAAQTQATLTIPSTGFTKTFTGTNASNLQSQIEDFIKGNGQNAYAAFLQQMDQISKISALDGNPGATTAIVANDAFTRFGIHNSLSQAPYEAGNGAQFSADITGGAEHASDIHGHYVGLNLDSTFRLGSHLALSFDGAAHFRSIGASEVYTLAEEIGAPITVLVQRGNGISWTVTPWGFGSFTASYDQASGSVLVGGGGTSDAAIHLGDFTVTLADQISYASDLKISSRGYAFDTPVNQWILKNGLDVAYRFHDTPISIDVGGSYSNFLRHAAVPNFWSPTVGLDIDFSTYSGMRLGYDGDYARGYHNTGGELSVFLSI